MTGEGADDGVGAGFGGSGEGHFDFLAVGELGGGEENQIGVGNVVAIHGVGFGCHGVGEGSYFLVGALFSDDEVVQHVIVVLEDEVIFLTGLHPNGFDVEFEKGGDGLDEDAVVGDGGELVFVGGGPLLMLLLVGWRGLFQEGLRR